MRLGGGAATCVPVKLGTDAWETAIYLQVSGPECQQDHQVLSDTTRAVPLGIETDLVEHQHASVVILRFEVHTDPEDPFAGEILLTPGENSMHFDALDLLTRQPRLCWFFGDQHYRVIRAQEHALSSEQHAGFSSLLNDAVRHDALVRCASRYDARAALSGIVSRYELRAGRTGSSN